MQHIGFIGLGRMGRHIERDAHQTRHLYLAFM
jgi:3-hydroxyisobutyrate dehydrogenase-like beta-hydroxyacid dehydrogenase